jgi:hypothetical protein
MICILGIEYRRIKRENDGLRNIIVATKQEIREKIIGG